MNIAGIEVGWNEIAVIVGVVLLVYTAYMQYYLMHMDDRLQAIEKLLKVE
jgi:hypothetical protein